MIAPRVTVLMTVFNAAPFVRGAVVSILEQSFREFELLVVDDASTDASPEILRSFTDARVRVIRNEENRGVTFSRRRALESACGEYVAILDADDVARATRLQCQVGYLDRHPEIDLLGTAYVEIDARGRVIRNVRALTDSLTIRWKLLFGNCIAHSTVMFRRAPARELGGYDARVFAGEDFDLWMRIAARGQIAQLDLPLTEWRSHAQGLQRNEQQSVKEHYVRTVAQSIRRQTGIEVEFEVARALYRDIRARAASPQILRQAFAVLGQCLRHFIARSAQDEHQELRALALEEIFRLAARNPGSFHLARHAAAQCVPRGNWIAALNRRAAQLAAVSALPAPAIDFLYALTHRNWNVGVGNDEDSLS